MAMISNVKDLLGDPDFRAIIKAVEDPLERLCAMMLAHIINAIENSTVIHTNAMKSIKHSADLASLYSEITLEFLRLLRDLEERLSSAENTTPLSEMTTDEWKVFLEQDRSEQNYKDLIISSVFFMNARTALETHLSEAESKFTMKMKHIDQNHIGFGLLSMEGGPIKFPEISRDARRILWLYLCTEFMGRCIEVVNVE